MSFCRTIFCIVGERGVTVTYILSEIIRENGWNICAVEMLSNNVAMRNAGFYWATCFRNMEVKTDLDIVMR